MKSVTTHAGLVLLASIGFGCRPTPQGDGGPSPDPHGAILSGELPDPTPVPTYATPREDVIAEWRRAGASYDTGWDPDGVGSDVPEAQARMPRFTFDQKPTKYLKDLPRPQVPFAVVTPDSEKWETAVEYQRWMAGFKDQPDLRGLRFTARGHAADALTGIPATLEWLSVGYSKLTPNDLSRIGGLSELRSLSLNLCEIYSTESTCFASLGKLSNLRFLRLNALAFKVGANPVAMSGNGLEHLRGLVRLRYIGLSEWTDKFGVQQPPCNLSGLADIPNLRTVSLTGAFYQANCLATLKRLPHWRHLSLVSTAELPSRAFAAMLDAQPTLTKLTVLGDISEEPFNHLQTPERLTEFHVIGSLNLSSARGRGLARLTGLTALTCRVVDHNDEWVAALEPLVQLRQVSLDSFGITDSSLSSLKSLVNLEKLRLSSDKLDGTGLSYLRGAEKLKHLDVMSRNLNDSGLAAISKLSSLREVKVGTSFLDSGFGGLSTDSGIAELAKLPHLKSLDVKNIKTSATGLEQLRKARPDIVIRN